MVLLGEVIDGREAERIGLAWCVPDAELAATCQVLGAWEPAAAPRELVRRTKQTMADVTRLSMHDDAVERELVPRSGRWTNPSSPTAWLRSNRITWSR